MMYATIEHEGRSWELVIGLDDSATITVGRVERYGTFCGELLHDFVGRNYVPEAVLTLLLEELNR